MIYTVPMVNGGGDFNTETGEFTVPCDSLYMFTEQNVMCTYNKKRLHLQIMATDQIIEAISNYKDSIYGASTWDLMWQYCPLKTRSGYNVIQQVLSDDCNSTIFLLLINIIHFTLQLLSTPVAKFDQGISRYKIY